MLASRKRIFAVTVTVVALGAPVVAQQSAGADPSLGAWGWGATLNTKGQVGRGAPDGSPVPVPVAGVGVGSGVQDVAAGGNHSLAALDTGQVLAWGVPQFGALGNGQTSEVGLGTPTPVIGLSAGSGVVAVAAGGAHSLALTSTGAVYAWGWNEQGQVGDGTTINRSTAVLIPGLSNVVGISGGYSFSLALRADGSVWAWGANDAGQRGDPALPSSAVPVPVPGLGAGSGVVQVSAGLAHGTARTSDGRVFAWGADGSNPEPAPVHPVPGLEAGGAVDIDGGGGYTLVAMADGSMLAWGFGGIGRRCDGGGATTTTATATDFAPGVGVVDVEAGWQNTLVALADGRVYGCGYDQDNQLGNGNGGVGSDEELVKLHPVPVDGFGIGSGVVDIAAGFAHGLAIASTVNASEPPPTTTTTSGPPTTTTTTVPPLVTASVGDVVVSEGDSGSRVAAATITLDHTMTQKVTVRVSGTSANASALDFTPFSSRTVAIPAGASSAKVSVTYLGDTSADGTKTINLALQGSSTVGIVDGVGSVTIVDDDGPTAAAPEASVSDARAYEGDGTTTKVSFTVALSRPTTVPVSVRVSTVGLDATAGTDFTSKSNVLVSFPAGVRSKLVTITVRDDTVLEGNEAFVLQASQPVGMTIVDDLGIGTIANDD